MKVPQRSRKWGLQFNITPLIDVILLLIIFFLAASHLARSETLQEVDLPEAEQAQHEGERQPRRLMITVTADEKFHVRGDVVTLKQIRAMLNAQHEGHQDGFEVRLRVDRSVPYRRIEPVMLACARSGVSDVKFAVLPK